jgi:hypothetical protein
MHLMHSWIAKKPFVRRDSLFEHVHQRRRHRVPGNHARDAFIMDIPTLQDKHGPVLHRLGAGATVEFAGRSGSVVRVLQGRTWMTQEGDARDYVVPAGMRFCIARRGHVVVSAVTDDTIVALYRVRPSPASEWSQNRVCFEIGFALTARREAQREMSRQIAAILSRLWRRIRQSWPGRTARRSCLRGHHCG